MAEIERQNRDAGGHAKPGREGREVPETERESEATREAREREGREERGAEEPGERSGRPAHVGPKRETTAADLARENA